MSRSSRRLRHRSCGWYIVQCDTPARAHELAAVIPDARYTAIEVRPIMNEGGMEM